MHRRLVLAAVAAVVLLAGCSTTRGTVVVEGPAWVTKGAGAFKDSRDKAFYGVGAASGIRNKPLAMTTADNRARAEVGKIFETYSASLMKDYARSTTAGSFENTSEEQDVSLAVKTFSASTLSGVQIVDRWQDPSDGTIYALARLDLESFKDSLDTARELNARVRDYVRANAERAFDDLAAEEAKRAR